MGINDSVDLVKKALDMKTEIARVEDREALIEAKSALIDLKAQLNEYKETVQELELKLSNSQELLLGNGCYIKVADGVEIPICTNCWDSDNKTIRLSTGGSGPATCPKCKNYFMSVDKVKFNNQVQSK